MNWFRSIINKLSLALRIGNKNIVMGNKNQFFQNKGNVTIANFQSNPRLKVESSAAVRCKNIEITLTNQSNQLLTDILFFVPSLNISKNVGNIEPRENRTVRIDYDHKNLSTARRSKKAFLSYKDVNQKEYNFALDVHINYFSFNNCYSIDAINNQKGES